jgi:lambda family phage tail tape measure protein
MASQNIARLGVVLGLDTAEFTAQVDKAISENRKLKNAIKSDSQAALRESAALKLAAEDYGKTLTKVQQIEREINSGRFMNATKEMKQQLLERAAAYDKVANATKNATAAQFKMNEQQKIQLTYQTTDLFTQLASGQNPLIAVIQQGGQLKDVMGGVGNALKAIGSLFTLTKVIAGGFAGALGAVAYAAYSGRDEFDKFKDTLTLTGNYAGITTEKFYKLSEELSSRTNASLGMTKDALNAIVASGKFTETSISAVTQSVITYAQIAGVDAKTAAEKLMSGLDGTASGARSLNKEMNFLTLEQYKQIEALEKAGKRQEAAQVAAIALNTQLAAQRRELGTLEKAWEGLTNGLSGFWNMLKDIGKPETTDQVISQLDRQIKAVQDALGRNTGNSKFEEEQKKQLQSLKNQREALLETERLKARSAAARDVGDSKQKIEDRAGAGGMDKERQIIFATEKLKADIKYTQALATANEIGKIELEAEKLKEEKRAEFRAKSDEEKRAMGGLLAKQLAEEELLIEAKKNEKIRLIRQKEKIDIAKAQVDEQKQFEEMNNQYAQMQATARQTALDKTQSLELDKEDLQLRQQMLYASEQEQKLAEIRLKYQRLQSTTNGDPVREQQLKRQQELEEFNVTLQESMQKNKQVFDSVWGNMSSAIDNFVKTGKLSMKDFARSVIQDLIAIQMKAAALSFLRMMFAPSMGPSMAGGGPLPSSFNQYLAPKAAGGPVSGNTPYLIGEKGPELFMPSGSGTIVPNNKMGQMGGTTNVTNNYINAIDTKSFEDRLLGSSNAVWAANQYAGKSLAVNRGRA